MEHMLQEEEETLTSHHVGGPVRRRSTTGTAHASTCLRAHDRHWRPLAFPPRCGDSWYSSVLTCIMSEEGAV